jgi:hypothetical protein
VAVAVGREKITVSRELEMMVVEMAASQQLGVQVSTIVAEVAEVQVATEKPAAPAAPALSSSAGLLQVHRSFLDLSLTP